MDGSVTIIKNVEVELNSEGYTRREKLYDKNNIWLDTKPLIIGRDR